VYIYWGDCVLRAVLEESKEGYWLRMPVRVVYLRKSNTFVALIGSETENEYVYVFRSKRVKRFIKSLLNSLAEGYLRTDLPVAIPLVIELKKTKRGVFVAEDFYNDLLLTLFVLENIEKEYPVKGNNRLLILRRVSASVVRGSIYPPTEVKAVRFWRGDELLYEGYAGYDKRLKFKARFVRDLVQGVVLLQGVLTEVWKKLPEGEVRDVYLDVDVEKAVRLIEFKEPFDYVDIG